MAGRRQTLPIRTMSLQYFRTVIKATRTRNFSGTSVAKGGAVCKLADLQWGAKVHRCKYVYLLQVTLQHRIAVIHGEQKESESDMVDGRYSPPTVLVSGRTMEVGLDIMPGRHHGQGRPFVTCRCSYELYYKHSGQALLVNTVL
ncbi:hypothetical protein HPB49_004448 [Dermacentor silvarum]|uniref:Uncharacterized protein n=1 Tax=Dermacentor silvarum TaxID=543639 RepID=A0ACB8D2Z2_DERSI|nr:hypothetical protein HPB49_004448 [Dermacentor silvarum]